MNRTPFTPMATPPTRQGFYEVTLKDESVVVAEWKQMAKSEPKQWFRYVSDDPTQEKQPVVLRGVCGWRKADTDTVKQALKRRKPGFSESYYGFRSFNSLLEEAKARGLVEIQGDAKSGGYIVRSAYQEF